MNAAWQFIARLPSCSPYGTQTCGFHAVTSYAYYFLKTLNSALGLLVRSSQTQLFDPRNQSSRPNSQELRRPCDSFDSPTGLLEHDEDIFSFPAAQFSFG